MLNKAASSLLEVRHSIRRCRDSPHATPALDSFALLSRRRDVLLRELDETHRVDRVLAVARTPVEMRAGHTARGAHEADLLAALHGVPHRDECLGQVEVPGDDSRAVIDVHDISGEEEAVDQRNNAPIRGTYRIAGLAGEIHAPVTTRQATIEQSPRSEGARDPRAPGA